MKDFSRYDFAHDGFMPPWSIDQRHRNALYAMAMHCTGNVVEIGCFRGYSTAAFIEALNDGADFTIHLVDIKTTPELRRVVAMCDRPHRVRIYETHATEFRITDDLVSLVFVDGDHQFAACQDVLNAISSNAQIIAMHDTNAHPEGFAECEGAYVAANALKAWRSRRYLEDKAHRAGECTHRGFLASFDTSGIRDDWKQKAWDDCKAALDAP